MNEKLQLVMKTFKTNMYLVEKALEGLTDEEFKRRPSNQSNSMQFILSHLVGYRIKMCAFAGMEYHADFVQHTTRGMEPPDSKLLPSLDEIKHIWAELSEIFFDTVPKMTDAQLQTPLGRTTPFDDDTVFGGIAFFAFHETYHAGQMGYVRRLLGHSQVVG